MKFYHAKYLGRARSMRWKGESIGKISKNLGIPDSTISRWVRDIKSQEKIFSMARERETQSKKYYLERINNIAIDSNNAKILCSLLYWCEGAKHPANNFVAFANSDEKLIKVFLFLLRKGFAIDENKLRAHLQLHTTHNVNSSVRYWSKSLNIPIKNFYKPTITKPNKLRKRNNYLGTCTIKYFDVNLLLGITGLYESFAKRIFEY